MNEKTIVAIRNIHDLEIRKFENTKHEVMFSVMFPHFERQVVFGTGKGGLKKWLTKKFTVDFLDRQNLIAYEIDGKSHNTKIGQINDQIKRIFLEEKGIKVVHLTNMQVEKLYDEHDKIFGGILNDFAKNT